MKKLLSAVAAVVLLSSSFVVSNCESVRPEIVSVDSLLIMQKSAEGKVLASKIESQIQGFQNEVKASHEDLTKMQETLSKQAKGLSQEALEEQRNKIEKKRKNLEREFADKEEALRASIQKQQIALRETQLKVVTQQSEQKGWAAVMDKNTPGLICVSSAIDRTDEILRAVDASYEASKAKKTTVKTASADSVVSSKSAVKTA